MKSLPLLALCCWFAWHTSAVGVGGPKDRPPRDVGPSDAKFAPYSADVDHLWNRLHRGLFVRAAPDGSRRVHSTDPFLYRYGTFLLEGESHVRAVALLDEFLAGPDDRDVEPLKRLFLHRDLWAAFDYAAWVPDEWVHFSKHEPAAIALRTRLASGISRLALSDREIAALSDNYAMAVTSKEYPGAHDPDHPERPFLPTDLHDPAGPWVRFKDTTTAPMARRHFQESGGRALHVVFLRLPGGRAATEKYLQELSREDLPRDAQRKSHRKYSAQQFPPGTMLAMVRRALAVDSSAKLRVTPLTELVQIRVYRRIPEDADANFHGDFGEQDMYEFVLDRESLFSGKHGLRAVGAGDPEEPFERDGHDPEPTGARRARPSQAATQLKSCIQCHQAPGILSVLSMENGLRANPPGARDNFRTSDGNEEMNSTIRRKLEQYNWGLLQGMLEAKR
jgi:hypothetical protein